MFRGRGRPLPGRQEGVWIFDDQDLVYAFFEKCFSRRSGLMWLDCFGDIARGHLETIENVTAITIFTSRIGDCSSS